MREIDSFEKDPVIKNSKQESNFRAIKHLMEAEDSIRIAHNRIRVLQINEQKNVLRINNQMGLINKIQEARQFSSIHNSLVKLLILRLSQTVSNYKKKLANLR